MEIVMESYIVRVYHRGECQRDGIVGLVEPVETGQIHEFRSPSELMAILEGAPTNMKETATERRVCQSA